MSYARSYVEQLIETTSCDTFEKLYAKYSPIPGVISGSRVSFFKDNFVCTNHSCELYLRRLEPHINITPMTISFYDNNWLHRWDGPARYYAMGSHDWYIRGRYITYDMENYVDDIRNVTNEDILTLKMIYS